jgi:beta-hydroxylase
MPNWTSSLVEPRFLVLYVFLACGLYVHLRGRERHGLLRQLTDHSTFMGPYNVLMYLFSAVPTTPILDHDLFPELEPLRRNWETIRDEALALEAGGGIRKAAAYNDLAFNSFFRRGWTRFYLKWYGDYLPSAKQHCPRTVELLDSIPRVRAAMFAALTPRSHLVRHRDPFAGSLRYHLGLKTPNSDDCRIDIDGEPYAWRDGDDVIFDETYIHKVVNDTDEHRLILFCDLERPLRLRPLAALNRFIGRWLGKATATQNVPSETVGIFNQAFGYIYRVRLLAKRVREKSVLAYNLIHLALLAGLIYWIFF